MHHSIQHNKVHDIPASGIGPSAWIGLQLHYSKYYVTMYMNTFAVAIMSYSDPKT